MAHATQLEIDRLAVGMHLVTPRRGYTHHGIYAGDGRVIHYSGLSRSLRRGPVQETTLVEFADGHEVWTEPAACAKYSGQDAVERAYQRLGEQRYRITTNNCEHFCAWCLYGESRSEQVERWLGGPRRAMRAARKLLALAMEAAMAATTSGFLPSSAGTPIAAE